MLNPRGLIVLVLSAIVLLAVAARARAETCIASHYGVGDGYGGRRTASGERMNPQAMTAAHRRLPFGTHVRVTNLRNGKTVAVRVTDRGPWIKGRCIDLSYGAARAVGISGIGRVSIEVDSARF